MENEAICFYSSLFSLDLSVGKHYSICCMFHHVAHKETDVLRASVTNEEVDNAVFEMAPLKAPGVDGLHLFFYQNWSLVALKFVCPLYYVW